MNKVTFETWGHGKYNEGWHLLGINTFSINSANFVNDLLILYGDRLWSYMWKSDPLTFIIYDSAKETTITIE